MGKAACSIDVATGEIIYARSMDRILYPASMTKLITAVLLAEKDEPGDILNYSRAAKNVYPYKLDFPVGEQVSAMEAMYGLLLFSGNDIAYMIAENLGGDIPGFARMMNGKVREWNLKHTRFVTPSGLHDPGHYSSAYDMTMILRHAARNPWIASVMEQTSHILLTESGHKYPITNRNKLVGVDGCIGGKTGWTPEAGRCLAALFERNGRRIAAVVMDSVYDAKDTVVFKDMENLINYSYSAIRKQLVPAERVIKRVRVKYKVIPLLGPEREAVVPLYLSEPVMLYMTRDGRVDLDFRPDVSDPWSLSREKPAGDLRVIMREYARSYALYPALDAGMLFKENIVFYILFGGTTLLIILLAVLLTVLIRRRRG
ncbi:MAG: D-alanyl-D-alanine carboxypeptidase [Spirochaetales bacterium]|nr:D-alanyl-D-alanine carboxypeptidase [Spirochaetales bacterium]